MIESATTLEWAFASARDVGRHLREHGRFRAMRVFGPSPWSLPHMRTSAVHKEGVEREIKPDRWRLRPWVRVRVREVGRIPEVGPAWAGLYNDRQPTPTGSDPR